MVKKVYGHRFFYQLINWLHRISVEGLTEIQWALFGLAFK